MTSGIAVAGAVADALARGEAVVALESTVIAHGLPYPRGAEVAGRLEAIVREEGGCPATIGIVDGQATVGLGEHEIERFARGDDVLKASVRDLGPLIAAGRTAATTVAATAVLAARAGLDVFATGGIGGVHRGGEASLDISADLVTLARTPVAVVSAGAKAILDLPRTLEVLETLGVPLVGLRTDEFPAFYTRDSGLELEHAVADEREAARVVRAHRALGLRTAILVCNPPPEDPAWTPAAVADLVGGAERDAAEAGIRGKELTPWLLARLAERSAGRTVERNVALLESNVRVATRLARALRSDGGPKPTSGAPGAMR